MSQPEQMQRLMPQLLTEKQVEELTGIKRSTLQNWRVAGKGPPYIKFGPAASSSVRYDGTQLMEYIDQHRRYPSVRAFMEEANGTT